MSEQPRIALGLLRLPSLERAIAAVGLNPRTLASSTTSIWVDAEELAAGERRIRRDVAVTYLAQRVPVLVLVLEAKSARARAVGGEVVEQVRGYLDAGAFPRDADVPTVGVVLTRHLVLHDDDSSIATLRWSELVSFLRAVGGGRTGSGDRRLIRDYVDFVTGAARDMQFYEREVLSLPAGETFAITNATFVHACPDRKRGFQYATPIFLTFRARGGVMERLYRSEDIVVLNPKDETELARLRSSDLPYADRVLAYIARRSAEWKFSDDDYRFYVLAEHDFIDLAHRPRKPKLRGHCYFTIAELLKGHRDVVPESQRRSGRRAAKD